MSKAVFIAANDSIPITETNTKPKWLDMEKFIQGYIETLGVRYQGRAATMLCNENGCTERRPLNSRASRVVRDTYVDSLGLGEVQDIVGNVIILVGFKP